MGKALRVFILNMFLGRVYRRKKGKVPLLALQTLPKTPPMSHWRPPLRHVVHRERCWLEACLRAHDSFCGCPSAVVHFSSLVARFNLQGGPPPEDDSPQDAPVLRALPAPSPRRQTRTENPSGEPWPTPTGGAAGGGRGEADGGAGGAADDYRAEDLDDLFAAIEGDQ